MSVSPLDAQGIRDAIKTLSTLTSLESGTQRTEIEANAELFTELLRQIALLLSQSCGNINKVHEKITQLELITASGENVSVEHRCGTYGADINIHEAGKVSLNVECKNSVTTKKKHYKTNWMFTLSTDMPLDDLLSMTERLKQKFGEGYTQLTAESKDDGRRLNDYKLSNAFVANLLARLAFKNGTRKINLGRTRCNICEKYHYIENLLLLDERMKSGKLQDHEWSLPYESYQCKV